MSDPIRAGRRAHALPALTLLLYAALMFGMNLGGYGLVDPDEPFYALTARQMLERGDAATPVLFGRPQFEKPVLVYWALVGSFRLLGVNEAAARLVGCLAAIGTTLLVYFWGVSLFRRRAAAFAAAVVFASAAESVALGRLVLTDMPLCFFMTASGFAAWAVWKGGPRAATARVLLALALALGFLTKGPLAVLLPAGGAGAFLAVTGGIRRPAWRAWVLPAAVFAAVALPWYALMTARHGTGFLSHFFLHENVRRFFVAEHRGFDRPHFYPLVLAAGFFPWTALLPATLVWAWRRAARPAARPVLFLLIAALVPLAFFTAAKSKLPSYIFPVFPALALLVGAWAARADRAFRLGRRPRAALVACVAAVWGIAPAGLAAGLAAYAADDGLDLTRPLAAFALALVMPFALALVFFVRRRGRLAFGTAAAGAAIASAVFFGSVMPAASDYLSSERAVAAWRAASAAEAATPLLASKMFVRGVSYYARREDMGVVAEFPDKTFYTKHPLPFFSSAADFEDLELPVYCFLRPKEIRLLEERLDGRYELAVLGHFAERSLVRLEARVR